MSAPKQRLYLDNGDANPAISTEALNQDAKALFANWVYAGFHERDFIEAVEHTATNIYGEFLMMGVPDLKDEVVEKVVIEKHPDERVKRADKLRFYDAQGNLTHGICTDFIRKVLAGHFVQWINQDFHGRDFIQAAKNESMDVYYHYDTCRSMGGLGGCDSADGYLDKGFVPA